MATPDAKCTDDFRHETADSTISTGRQITECCAELDLSPKADEFPMAA